MGQERSTPWQRNKPLAKNVVPATVVPWRDCAKGNREERGCHHAAIWTDLSVQHTAYSAEEIKVTQLPFKCASMLGHRLRVDKKRMITHTHMTSILMVDSVLPINNYTLCKCRISDRY